MRGMKDGEVVRMTEWKEERGSEDDGEEGGER